LRHLLSDLLTVHFFITLFVLLAWLFALQGPLASLSELLRKVVTDDGTVNEGVIEALSKVGETVTLVSARFTTIVGTVVGYYFGQRGHERVEKALVEGEMERAQVIGAAAETAGDAVENLKSLNDALLDAVALIPDDAEIAADSALGRMLAGDS
jgi:hypothetical protein